MSGNGVLNSEQWHILVCGVERAASAVLLPLALLNSVYSRNCHRYYGDLAHIKVAARKDSTAQRNARLRHLAQQVKQL